MRDRNPFTPGAGKEPPYLAGRAEETGLLSDALAGIGGGRPGDTVIMYGPRGMGKTVLLRWMRQQCKPLGVDAVLLTSQGVLRASEGLGDRLLSNLSSIKKQAVSTEASFDATVAGAVRGGGKRTWSDPGPDAHKHLTLARRLAERASERPLAVLMDEAHAPDSEAALDALSELVGAAQIAAADSPFLLVLAGTPKLEQTLKKAHCTFTERDRRVLVGPIADDAEAANAIRKPLNEHDIAIAEDALRHIARHSQGYPYFLQHWGEALWKRAIEKQDKRALTMADTRRAEPLVNQIRNEMYEARFSDMLTSRSRETIAAANAVAGIFVNSEYAARPDEADIDSAIESALRALPAKGRTGASAVDLRLALNDEDVIWRRRGARHFEPGIPSFMAYVREQCQQRPELITGAAGASLAPPAPQ